MLCMARAQRRSARPSGRDPLRVNRSHFARRSVAAACPHRAHRLERLEPYEGKLSSTVLRGGRAGNSPPPLDLGPVRFSSARPPFPSAVYSVLPLRALSSVLWFELSAVQVS